ncbi:MAG: hypothetical protein II695_05815, partial [Oscillospiraceae bacterium]|nr:hypothetical protein [Oscillospiraceae bacterium]
PDNKVYQFLQTEKINFDYEDLKKLYDEAGHAASILRSEDPNSKWASEREQLIQECRITDYYGEKAYYKEYSSKSFSGMILACPAYNDSIVFLCERPESITPQRYDDIRCILSGGSPYEKYTHTFLAGSAVFLLLFITAAAGMKMSGRV